jgi:hypothetical protein
VHDVFKAVTLGLLRQLATGARKSKQIETRDNELGAKERLKGTRHTFPL